MKILITGSSGYLGRLLVRYFTERKITVVGLDVKEDKEPISTEYFRFYRTCITAREELREIFMKENPTDVIHFACTFNKVRSRQKEYEIDIGGSANIFELSDATPSVRKLIYSSSAAIYGGEKRSRLWLTEADSLNPGRYRYGSNKKMIEELLFNNHRRSNLRVVSLRICTVIGPSYSKPGSVVSLLIRLPWFPRSFMENKIQFLHEEDFSGLFRCILEDGNIEGVYNLSSDSYSVIREITPEKKFISFPVGSIRPVLWILWHLRLLNLQPAGFRYTLYPVLLDPARLISRFGYRFRYSSSEAFHLTSQNNRLPASLK